MVTRTGIEPQLKTGKTIGITALFNFCVQFRVQLRTHVSCFYIKNSNYLDFSMLPKPPHSCYAPVINETGGELVQKILIAIISEAIGSELSRSLPQYEVHICNTGTEALKMLEALQPDILILDLMLPIIDGLTVLRESSFKPRIILARTNLISATVLYAAADVGVQDILLIPCSTRYIVDRLDALIEKAPSPEV